MEALILYFAGLALVASASWVVASPFRNPPSDSDLSLSTDAEPDPWQRRREEALAAIRDADFDYQLGKLSAADYRDLRRRLERTALEAMDAVDRGGDRA